MTPPVLVTEPEYAKGEPVFRSTTGLEFRPAPADEAALSAAVLQTQARVVIIGVVPYTGPLYRALQATSRGHGALLARFGVGHDGVDKAQARENGIIVCNTPGVLDVSVAEHTLWLMGNVARHLSQLEARLRGGEFRGETGGELCGKRLGILGFGRIGRKVAKIAHLGFGMEIWAAGKGSLADLEAREGRSLRELRAEYGLELYTDDADQLLQECDYLSLHLPALPATRHFINAARLALLKPGAVLINTARGSLVDEAALYDALAAGKLAGAGLDVFEREPYQPVTPERDLRKLANVVLTPHVSSNTREANQRMAAACVANVRHFFNGNTAQLTRVDPL
jgi:lactate dehydrogenase-like 2-hydroxyacid dehydrogenase